MKRVKKIRRRLRASSGADRGSTTQPSSTTAGKTAKKRKGGEKNPEVKTEVKAETLDEHAVGLMWEHVKKDRSRLADQRVKKDHATEDIPPDWGGSSDENVQEAGGEQQWPWGNAGRPFDRGSLRNDLMNRRGIHPPDEIPVLNMEEGDAPN